MNTSGKYLWPTAAILAGGIAAWVTQSTPQRSTEAYSASTARQLPAAGSTPEGDSESGREGSRIQGKVLETITVPNYVYLRIALDHPIGAESAGNKPLSEVWAAVDTAEVTVGQVVTVTGAQRMDGFTSSTLKRTFEVIYFGALGGPGAKLPSGHPDISGSATVPADLPAHSHSPPGKDALSEDQATADVAAGAVNPHAMPATGGDAVPVGKVERASGKLGHSVSEIVDNRKALAGQKVRVRGMVVKSTSGVLGRTFVHLRDGTGNSKSGDHDLTATTEQATAVGSTVLFEGTVVTDKDFGAGYTYPVLLENAHRVTE
jgi:hypothetical protein